jgi:hypothetical protein
MIKKIAWAIWGLIGLWLLSVYIGDAFLNSIHANKEFKMPDNYYAYVFEIRQIGVNSHSTIKFLKPELEDLLYFVDKVGIEKSREILSQTYAFPDKFKEDDEDIKQIKKLKKEGWKLNLNWTR